MTLYKLEVVDHDTQFGVLPENPELTYKVSEEYGEVIYIVLPDDQILTVATTPDYRDKPMVFVRLRPGRKGESEMLGDELEAANDQIRHLNELISGMEERE